MTRTKMLMAALAMACFSGHVMAQESAAGKTAVKRNYFVTTSNVRQVSKKSSAGNADAESAEGDAAGRKDFISRNFEYVSMCDWKPGMRFMVKPTQKDLVLKTFADSNTGNMVSTRSLIDSILVFDGHSNPNGSLHEQINFHIEGDANRRLYFEVPTASFDDYCYNQQGVPTLAYLDEVDRAIDSLTGKQVRVLVRELNQDTETAGGGYKPIDLGESRKGEIMTITKVGVGTRNFPVKIIVKEKDRPGAPGQEYFQYVTISRTNCGIRDDEFERSDLLRHTFKGSFELLADRMAVTGELKDWVGKNVYTFFATKMRNEKEDFVSVPRLTSFAVTDIYRLGDSDKVTLTLKGKKNGAVYTKEVSVTNTKVNGSEDVLDQLFIEGDPTKMAGVRAANMPAIVKQQVKRGFTEAEVKLALGEPTEVKKISGVTYQWEYHYVDSSRPFRIVKFNKKTKRVIQDMTR